MTEGAMMSTIKLMLPYGYNIVSGFKNYYKHNPISFFKSSFDEGYVRPFYNENGFFYTKFKSNIRIDGFDYKPKVWLCHRRFWGYLTPPNLYIEFSASKSLFGNSYCEWIDDDLDNLIDWLWRVLKAMGIDTTKEALFNARVDKMHFSKNFIFPDEITFKAFFELLKKTKYPNLKGKSILYENGGTVYRYHSDIWAISLYNKLRELMLKNPELAEQLKSDGINYVLRAEVQFNDRLKLEKFMKNLGFREENTLANMFKVQRLIAVFNKVFMNLHKKSPYFYQNTNTNAELLKSIKAGRMADLTKQFLFLVLQRENSFEEAEKAISELDVKGSKFFYSKQSYILTSNPYIQNIFLKLLSIVKEYEPIQNTNFDLGKFINFKI
jgi:hypothetical protein